MKVHSVLEHCQVNQSRHLLPGARTGTLVTPPSPSLSLAGAWLQALSWQLLLQQGKDKQRQA